MPLSLGAAFPMAAEAAVVAAAAQLGALEHGQAVIVDGLALGIDPRLARAAAARGPLIAMVHHPLALENGISAEAAAYLARTEREALVFADRIVVPSEATGATLIADYAVPDAKVSVAKPAMTGRLSPKAAAGRWSCCFRLPQSARGRALMCWSMRWQRCAISPGGWILSGMKRSIPHAPLRYGHRSRRLASMRASGISARCRRASWPSAMMRRMSSSSLRSMRAMAWCMRRRSPMAFRSSARRAGQSRRWCRRKPVSSQSPATPQASRRR